VQFLLLGSLSVGLNTSADLVVTALAGPLGNRIRSSSTSGGVSALRLE